MRFTFRLLFSFTFRITKLPHILDLVERWYWTSVPYRCVQHLVVKPTKINQFNKPSNQNKNSIKRTQVSHKDPKAKIQNKIFDYILIQETKEIYSCMILKLK